MQTFVAATLFSRAGFTMLACDGRATCADPGPWHFSQPTFHSVTAFVCRFMFTEWQPSHSCPVGRPLLSSGKNGTHQSVFGPTLYGRQIPFATSHCAPSG